MSANNNSAKAVKPKTAREIEVEANGKIFFEKLHKGKFKKHEGKYALMKNKKIIRFYKVREDAIRAGYKKYKDGIFSIQKVEDNKVNLGYYSYAVA